MSPFLELPLRSLRDLYDETATAALERERCREALLLEKTEAEMELRFHDSNALGYEYDRLGDELGPLLARMEEIEDEIAWAERGNEYRPMVL